jgi:putative glutamine amidotransferase
MKKTAKPVIGIICDVFPRDGKADRPFHGVAAEYIRAVQLGTRCTPLLIPAALEQTADWQQLCRLLDGILLTGSRTNVHPDRYAGQSIAGTLHDRHRDTTAFGLIDTALQCKTPLLGICRGFQEINVALGGTLHQNITAMKDKQNHAQHLDSGLPQDQQYQPAHHITLTAGGYLQALLGQQRIKVNSLHHQGIQQLAAALSQEAIADDGIIEAFSLTSDEQFLVAVQWHPEWHIKEDPVSQQLFSAFDEAVHQYAALKTHPSNSS